MATKTNSTPSRYAQLTSLLEFAKQNGYGGHTDKLEKVQTQWQAKGDNSQTYQENLGYAQSIKDFMASDQAYTNEQIRAGVAGLPVGTRGVVEPSKVNAIMNVGVDSGMFKVEVLGKMRFYSLA